MDLLFNMSGIFLKNRLLELFSDILENFSYFNFYVTVVHSRKQPSSETLWLAIDLYIVKGKSIWQTGKVKSFISFQHYYTLWEMS